MDNTLLNNIKFKNQEKMTDKKALVITDYSEINNLPPIMDYKEQEKVLSSQEWKLWQRVLPQAGTVMLQGPPGSGKSMIWKSIANKLRFKLFEFALTHMDSADLGGLPVVTTHESGLSVSKYAVNDWAIEANQGPSIIFLDEMNRPSEDIINALLKVLDKRLGLNYRLNNQVYIVSAGNLGMKEDGTTVSALDAAMNNRLIHVKWDPTLQDWVDNYATQHIHPVVISFLTSDEGRSHFRVRKHDAAAYATSRSWNNLSKFLTFYKMEDIELIKDIMVYQAAEYVGGYSATAFVSYLTSLTTIPIPSMKEIIAGGVLVEETLNKLNLIQKAYIINSFIVEDLADKTARHLGMFIGTLPEDLVALMYSKMITKCINISTDSIVDPEKKSLSINQVINPYKDVLNINRTISDKLLQSYAN